MEGFYDCMKNCTQTVVRNRHSGIKTDFDCNSFKLSSDRSDAEDLEATIKTTLALCQEYYEKELGRDEGLCEKEAKGVLGSFTAMRGFAEALVEDCERLRPKKTVRTTTIRRAPVGLTIVPASTISSSTSSSTTEPTTTTDPELLSLPGAQLETSTLRPGEIVGIVLGSLLFIFMAVTIFFLWRKLERRKGSPGRDSSDASSDQWLKPGYQSSGGMYRDTDANLKVDNGNGAERIGILMQPVSEMGQDVRLEMGNRNSVVEIWSAGVGGREDREEVVELEAREAGWTRSTESAKRI